MRKNERNDMIWGWIIPYLNTTVHSFVRMLVSFCDGWQVLHPPLKHITSAWFFVFNEFRLLLLPLSLSYTCFPLFTLSDSSHVVLSSTPTLVTCPHHSLSSSFFLFDLTSIYGKVHSQYKYSITIHYLTFLHTLRRI